LHDLGTIATVAIVIVLAQMLVSWWLIAGYRRKQRQTEEKLDRLNERLDQTVTTRTAELAGLSRYLLTAREEEKARIARELHDELGSSLTAVNMDLAWVRQRIEDPLLATRLARAAEVLTSTVQMKRRIIHELRPSMLDNLGLSSAIESHAADFSERIGVPIETDVPDELPRLKDGCSIALFRIFQEALTNASLHAQATRITVSLKHEGEQLALEVVDNGVGVDFNAAASSGAATHGLLSMREHALHYGGSVSVARGPEERGTVVRVVLPCVA
jgi:signal transduction histidine kinase